VLPDSPIIKDFSPKIFNTWNQPPEFSSCNMEEGKL